MKMKKRLDALERAVPQARPAYVLLVPHDEGRLISPDGRVWENGGASIVIDLDVTDGTP